MSDLISALSEITKDIFAFIGKVWKTTEFISELIFIKIKHYIKLIFVSFSILIRYIYYSLIELIIRPFSVLKFISKNIEIFIHNNIRLIKRFFNNISAGIKRLISCFSKILNTIFKGIRYVIRQIKSGFSFLSKNFIILIKKSPFLILFPIIFIFLFLITLVTSTLYYLKSIYLAVVNRTDRIDKKPKLLIKPIYNLTDNIYDSYLSMYHTIHNSKRILLKSRADRDSANDLIKSLNVFWFTILFSFITIFLMILSIPVNIILYPIALAKVPKDKKVLYDWISKRIINPKEINQLILIVNIDKRFKNLVWEIDNQSIAINKEINLREYTNEDSVEIKLFSGEDLIKNVTIPIRLDDSIEEIEKVYSSIIIPESINKDIDFTKIINNKIKYSVKSKNPKYINDYGVILNAPYNKKNKVTLSIKLFNDKYYMRKNIKTYIINKDSKSYLESIIKKIPSEIKIRKGKIKLINDRYINISYEEIKGKIRKDGYVYPSKYDEEYSIKVKFTIDEVFTDKLIKVIVQGNMKGLRNELSQIKVPKSLRECSIVKLPKVTELGKDNHSYEIRWTQSDKVLSTYKVELPEILLKNQFINLRADIEVNGMLGNKEFCITVKKSSKSNILKYESENLDINFKDSRTLELPRNGIIKDTRIQWISKTPNIINSKGKLKKESILDKIKDNQKAELIAIIIYKNKFVKKSFDFNIINSQFLLSQPIKNLNYNHLTFAELRKLAKERNFSVSYEDKKEDIISLLANK